MSIYTVWWKGEQHRVAGRDREHAKRVLYMGTVLCFTGTVESLRRLRDTLDRFLGDA